MLRIVRLGVIYAALFGVGPAHAGSAFKKLQVQPLSSPDKPGQPKNVKTLWKNLLHLFTHAKEVVNVDRIPGHPGGPANAKAEGRTDEADRGAYHHLTKYLPDSGHGLRRPKPSIDLLDHLGQLPQATVVLPPKSIFPVSAVHSGSMGFLRLGLLPTTGDHVVLKKYPKFEGESAEELEKRLLVEARGAKLLSDLGVGPRLYGLFKDPRGELNLVMEAIPGDLNGKITLQSIKDLETAIARFKAIGIAGIHDGQFMITPKGHLFFIDAGRLADAKAQEEEGALSYEDLRAEVLQRAPKDLGIGYLNWLKGTSRPEWLRFMKYITEWHYKVKKGGYDPRWGFNRYAPYLKKQGALDWYQKQMASNPAR